jgi:uncharacterized protein YgbK (DUF1537 family)
MSDGGLLLTYYGDDFTGSTDAMESLTLAGAKTVLFLKPPDAAALARHPGVRAVGVAGVTRSLTPDALEAELRPALTQLKALGAPVVQYKVCSTFDSSPQVGSIGRVIDVGRTIFSDAPFVPLVVGAPALGRYCVFGNLFATSGVDPLPYRLDRHPSMSRHPITPADESDLRIHLSRQTDKRIALFDLLMYEPSTDDARQSLKMLLSHKPEIVLFDAMHEGHLARIGQLLADVAGADRPLFAVGSSGLTAAVGSNWVRTSAVLRTERFPDPGEARPMLVASGSCSPVTAGQIDWALANGFDEVAVDTSALADPSTAEAAVRQATDAACAKLSAGRHVIVHTTRGNADPRLAATREAINRDPTRSTAEVLGGALGTITRAAVARTGVRRVLIAGGDTSGYLAKSLGVESLEMIAPLTPGAPLCRASAAPGSPVDGVEMNFKGGQVGRPDYFAAVARGGVE